MIEPYSIEPLFNPPILTSVNLFIIQSDDFSYLKLRGFSNLVVYTFDFVLYVNFVISAIPLNSVYPASPANLSGILGYVLSNASEICIDAGELPESDTPSFRGVNLPKSLPPINNLFCP